MLHKTQCYQILMAGFWLSAVANFVKDGGGSRYGSFWLSAMDNTGKTWLEWHLQEKRVGSLVIMSWTWVETARKSISEGGLEQQTNDSTSDTWYDIGLLSDLCSQHQLVKNGFGYSSIKFHVTLILTFCSCALMCRQPKSSN